MSCMTDNIIRFILSDDTRVAVKKVLNNKYDFELTFANGNRKTFILRSLADNDFIDGKGRRDSLINEAVKLFVSIMNG